MSTALPPPDVPIAPPPPGVQSNFEHPDTSRFPQMIATIAVCTTLALISVLARSYTRIWLVKSFGWDDVFAILSFFLVTAMMAAIGMEIKYGLTYYDWDVSLREFMINDLEGWLRWNSMAYLMYLLAFASIKMSFLCLYLRLLTGTQGNLRIAVWVLMVYVIIVLITGLSTLLAFCNPPNKLFNPLAPGTCNVNKNDFFIQAVLQVSTDLLILLPPIPMVWRLQLSTIKKLGIVSILSTGIFVTGISIARLVFLAPGGPEVSGLTLSGQYPSTYWGVLELDFALVAACLPALSQLIFRAHGIWSTVRSCVIPSSRARTGSIESPSKQNRKMRSPDCEPPDGAYVELGMQKATVASEKHEVDIMWAGLKRQNSSGGSSDSHSSLAINATRRWHQEEALQRRTA